MTDEQAWLSVKLAELADDFDRLSDPARDDANFFYDWEPPEWLVGGQMFPGGREAQDAAVLVAAMLREAVTMMKSL